MRAFLNRLKEFPRTANCCSTHLPYGEVAAASAPLAAIRSGIDVFRQRRNRAKTSIEDRP